MSLVSPGSAADPADVQQAIELLGQHGYEARTYRDPPQPMGYLSGDDATRADELNAAFADPDTCAVLCIRGGYGAVRMLDRVDYGAIRADPKPLVGYSDITALHAAIDREVGLVTYHGPNAIDGLFGGGKLDGTSVESFRRVASQALAPGDDLFVPTDRALDSLAGGVGEGRLVGGNLAVFVGLLGTQYEPDTEGRVLLLEDTGEAPYRIDRLLRQLQLASKLDGLAGVLLGDFTDCGDDQPTAQEVLSHYLSSIGAPVLTGCPFGHSMPNQTLPHGAAVRVDGDRRQVQFVGSR